MSLSDEASEKNLLIQLADRDIISQETILERFKEIPSVEKMRLKRERKSRNNEAYPDKAGPFHNANHKQELEKIDKQAEVNEVKEDKKKKEIKKNGRPPFAPDKEPRKKRVETPKSKPGLADLIVWTNDAFEDVSSTLNKAFLGANNKKNLRQLTKSEVCTLEALKIHALTNLDPMTPTDETSILKALSSDERSPKSFNDKLSDDNVSASEMPINSYKKKVIGAFVEHFFEIS
jgi:hypothetical protein